MAATRGITTTPAPIRQASCAIVARQPPAPARTSCARGGFVPRQAVLNSTPKPATNDLALVPLTPREAKRVAERVELLEEFASKSGSFRLAMLKMADALADAFETVFGGANRMVLQMAKFFYRLANRTADSNQATVAVKVDGRDSAEASTSRSA